MAPKLTRVAGYAAVGALSAAGLAYAVTHEYSRRRQRSASSEDPDLLSPDDVSDRVLQMRDGAEMHLVERGSGPPIVLVHGASLSASVWSYQLRDLAGEHRVIAVDLRGHGRSTSGREGVTISAMADDLAEAFETLNLRDAVLAGHSMGGMVCLRLARRHPQLLGRRIGAIGLISTSGRVGLPFQSWDRFAAAASRVAGSGATLFRAGRAAVPGGEIGYLASRVGFGREPRSAQVAATLRMLRATKPGVVTAVFGEVLGFEEVAMFDRVDVPVAVAVGTSDRLTPPVFARRLAASFKRASLSEYAGAGHMLMYERRGEIDELLDSLSDRAAAA
jgi:pimeloyl-ACP methyl ester carboxylesterase